jgi:MFS family permease
MLQFRPGGVWRSPAFVRLWGASVVSALGTSVTALALPLLAAVTLGATPFEMGLLVAAETLPILLFGLPVGVWVDRRAKRPVMVAADVGRALLLLLIPAAAWAGALRIELLLAIAFLVGMLGVFFEIAAQSFLPTILKTGELMEGNARLHTGWSIAGIGGPGLAGWLIQLFSAPVALVVDGVSYLVSALLLRGIGGAEPAMRSDAGGVRRFGAELAEGLRQVVGDPILRATATATGVWNLFDGARAAVFVLFLTRTLELSPAAIGLVFTLEAVGFLFGSLFPERVARRVGLGRAILLGGILSVPGALLVALAAGPPLVAAAMVGVGSFLTGVVTPSYDVNQFSLRQAVTPLRMQGRVNATMRTLIRGVLPLGAVLGGLLAEPLGLRGVMLLSVLGGPPAIAAIWFSPVRTLRRPPERTTDGG